MTLNDAIAQGPAWIGIWLNILLFGVLILPLLLLIWRASRLAGIATLVATVLSGIAVTWMYDQMGWVRLLGLPHVILYTPVAYFLFKQIQSDGMPQWPRRIMIAVLTLMMISLAFDYIDVLRYAFGDRNSLI